ncbi:MAG: glycosyltransferase [Gammaproteobacteria bacterium]|nr:MAG: glycosyltransferase [Gammaproteobacteria bacterium]
MSHKQILWWGRYGNYGPDYPRNRTIMRCMRQLGWAVDEFRPAISALGGLQAQFTQIAQTGNLTRADAVWVPCFRQRDLASAAKWANKHTTPVIFDPLISAYDKRVFEKNKFPAKSRRANRLLNWERRLFALADCVIADTECHKTFFVETLKCDRDKVIVIPVSAEEELFKPQAMPTTVKPEVLFFGTFIGLQGPTYIARLLTHYQGPNFKLTFLGDGPERPECERVVQRLLQTAPNSAVDVAFEPWIPFEQLPTRIAQASICLGVFGTGKKSSRVIPNKVYQALACGRPVITMHADAYPGSLLTLPQRGLRFIEPGNPQAIANAIADSLTAIATLESARQESEAAFKIYQAHFSNEFIRAMLKSLI